MARFELRYVAFAGNARMLQVRTASAEGRWSEWDYILNEDIPTVDASDIEHVVTWRHGYRPPRAH